MKILYLPIGRKTFDLEAAEKKRKDTSAYLNQLRYHIVEPENIITSTEELEGFLQRVQYENISLVIYQSVTFADAEFIQKTIEILNVPVIVWSVREPSVGGRLRLNSLTGGNSVSHFLRSANHPYRFIYGNVTEENLQKRLKILLDVHRVIQRLRSLKIGIVGEYPPGFFFSDTKEHLLHEKIGPKIEKFDLHKAFEESKQIPESQYKDMIERAEKQVIGIKKSDETVKRFAQFSTYVEKEIISRGISALAIRCWPDFFNELGAAACSTLSQFTEEGIVSSCESDIHGSISMFILRELAGSPPYLGDMVHIDEENNSAVFWHCGAGAYSLAHPASGAKAGVHPNRKLGLAMDFGLKPGTVTMYRLSYTEKDGFRFLVMRGKALDKPQQFHGTSVEVELETDITETLYRLMDQGFEPHYALVYDDVVDELIELGRQLNIETIVYTE